ncbi:MAG: hypothetical protein AAB271_01955, partial [Nitrospirota bacterium]
RVEKLEVVRRPPDRGALGPVPRLPLPVEGGEEEAGAGIGRIIRVAVELMPVVGGTTVVRDVAVRS